MKSIQLPLVRIDGQTYISLNDEVLTGLNITPDLTKAYLVPSESGYTIQRMVTVDLDIDDDVLKVLQEMAQVRGVSVSDLISNTLQDSLVEKE